MGTSFNLVISFAAGVLTFCGSGLVVFGLLTMASHSSPSEGIAVGAGPMFLAIIMWPVHGFFAVIVAATTFFLRQSRDVRKADEALAAALRASESSNR